MSSIRSYIYNIQQQLCLLWNFWRGVQLTVQQPYEIFQTPWMHEWDWAIKTCVELKDHSLDNNLSWEIHKKASPYQCGSKRCDLCLSEKVSIICADPDTLLNKRTELISKCRYRNKFLLAKVNSRHGVVFNCLLQFLYKDTYQNWHILCCSFFVRDLWQAVTYHFRY